VTRDEFARLVGDRIVHLGRAENGPSIRARGLWPTAALARAAGLDPGALVLRSANVEFQLDGHPVRLTHQRPLLKGRDKPFLDGHSLESWARQLDERLFFLPGRLAEGPFAASLGAGVTCHTLDARGFFDAFAPDIWLAPINSGNADRRPAWRGDWLYVPAQAGVAAFRANRQRRGLVAGPDPVREISIRQGIPPGLLARLMAR
jgi:hypothetical protein